MELQERVSKELQPYITGHQTQYVKCLWMSFTQAWIYHMLVQSWSPVGSTNWYAQSPDTTTWFYSATKTTYLQICSEFYTSSKMVGNGFTKSVLQVERGKCIEMCLNAALPYYNDITDPACPIPIYAGPIHLDRFLLVAESVNVRTECWIFGYELLKNCPLKIIGADQIRRQFSCSYSSLRNLYPFC